MKINAKKYFKEANELGLEPFSLAYSTNKETSVEIFNGEVESQAIGVAQDIGAKAIYNGKLGSFSTDAIDSKTAKLIAQNVLESAEFGREENKDNFFKGGLKYKKAKIDFKEFKPATLTEIRDAALELCSYVQAYDKRATQVTIDISMQESEANLSNTLGLKCGEKSKYFIGVASVVCEDETKEPRSGYVAFSSFVSLEDLIQKGKSKTEELIKSAVDFFKTGPCPSKKYKAVLSQESVASLLSFFLAQLNAKSVQKHLSLFEGKKDTQIMSKVFTLKHTPHVTTTASTSYDYDGYPTQDFTLIDKGVLKTYFYSVETANADGISSNGCASGNGNGSYKVITIKPGKKSKDELLSKMKDGIYITSISGLNSGINDQTLDFSLPCEGYLVKGGKIDKAVSMIVCAGNLKNLFSSAIALSNDSRVCGGIITPSILFKKLAISGE